MFINPVLLAKVRSKAITEYANGQACSLRLPGICNHTRATTVWAHLPGIGKSMGSKVSDLHGCFACSNCHSAIDTHSYDFRGLTDAMVLDAMLRGLAESQAILTMAGIIKVRGARLI